MAESFGNWRYNDLLPNTLVVQRPSAHRTHVLSGLLNTFASTRGCVIHTFVNDYTTLSCDMRREI
jgi:hypothetical protein